MTAIKIPATLIDVPAPFSSSNCSTQSRFTLPLIPGTSTRLPSRTLRDRCNFILWLALSPSAANPSTAGFSVKGELGPSAVNLPRRHKRSSVASLEIPAPALVPKEKEATEYFAGENVVKRGGEEDAMEEDLGREVDWPFYLVPMSTNKATVYRDNRVEAEG
ncbi:hypothetical protein B0H11DRAFT_1899624 [Mycena galericulata]|nr:hypothetical protein B0H11DRAFT_1899624 [Mycena galericulata]